MRRVTLLLALLLSLLLVGPTPGQFLGASGQRARAVAVGPAAFADAVVPDAAASAAPTPVTPGGGAEDPGRSDGVPAGWGALPVPVPDAGAAGTAGEADTSAGRGPGRSGNPGRPGGAGSGVAEEEPVAAVRGRRVCSALTATPQPHGEDRRAARSAVRRSAPAIHPQAPAGPAGGSRSAAGPRGPAELRVFRC
ncbi:hypothetical protein [Kitasatospora sp. NPDC088134]|uniref:hypothetical protein n=1 Tax=Kitasatospora sp. NPDC088134 TaxID=3364071 RepID=UPI0038067455